MNTSILWVSSPTLPCGDAVKRNIRAAGLLLVTLDSVDAALHLLEQFGVGAIVFPVDQTSESWHACARLVAKGSPVVVAIPKASVPDIAPRYISAGCAAVVADSSPAQAIATVLRDVVGGARRVVWPPGQIPSN